MPRQIEAVAQVIREIAQTGIGQRGPSARVQKITKLGGRTIIAHANFSETESRNFQPRVVVVDENNKKL